MCGNADGKSSIWEMHLCDDTAGDLSDALDTAKQTLDYFFETSAVAFDLGTKMTDAGQALQDTAGQSGSPGTGDHGQMAKNAGGPLVKGYLNGQKPYEKLLEAYTAGQNLETGDFSQASVVSDVEHAVKIMQDTNAVVLGEAAAIHDLILAAYPAADANIFGDEPSKGDVIAIKLAALVGDANNSASGEVPVDFRNASYSMGDTEAAPDMQSCYGDVINVPMVGLGSTGCGIACENTVYPKKCQAFSLYKVEGEVDLCFLFSEVKDFETFECEPSFLQKKAPTLQANAICHVSLSSNYKPTGEYKKLNRCLGTNSGYAMNAGVEVFSMPADTDLTVNGRTVLEKAS